jgi:hypothetical protein
VDQRRFVLVLVVILTTALLAPPVAGQADSDTVDTWRTLAPAAGEIDRANHTPIGTDVSAVLERDAIRYVNQHRRVTLAVEEDRIGSDSGRFDRLSAELERIDGRLDTLRARQESLTERYGAHGIQGRTLLTRLGTVGVHASALEDRLVAIRIAGRDIESRGIVRRANDHLARVKLLQGTVRSHVVSIQRGSEHRDRFYAEAANRSLALTTATDQDYLREVSVPDNRRNGGTAIGLSDAVSIVSESYPAIYAARQSIELGGSRRAGFYRVGIAGTGEFMTAYVDAESRSVFHEDRRVSLARLTLVPGPNTTQSGHRLSVATTYRGGPMRVTVERTDGEPVDARVRVGERVVGSTGTDGSLWTIAPPRTTVEARIDGTTLSLQFETPNPPPLNATPT